MLEDHRDPPKPWTLYCTYADTYAFVYTFSFARYLQYHNGVQTFSEREFLFYFLVKCLLLSYVIKTQGIDIQE